MFDTLDDSNFLLFTAKFYDNPGADSLEFDEDLNRIKYIKRLFRKYKDGKELKHRLILNHIIVLYNVFEPQACTRILTFRLYEYLEYLKPFLIYLNYWPDKFYPIGFNSIVLKDSDIVSDQYIIDKLRSI